MYIVIIFITNMVSETTSHWHCEDHWFKDVLN